MEVHRDIVAATAQEETRVRACLRRRDRQVLIEQPRAKAIQRTVAVQQQAVPVALVTAPAE